MKQRKYPLGFKEQALAKVFARSDDQTILSIADELNMNMGTLRGWMKVALRDQKNPPVKSVHVTEWTPAQRLLALHESHGLGEEALNAAAEGAVPAREDRARPNRPALRQRQSDERLHDARDDDRATASTIPRLLRYRSGNLP